jgi:hypothetical protein
VWVPPQHPQRNSPSLSQPPGLDLTVSARITCANGAPGRADSHIDAPCTQCLRHGDPMHAQNEQTVTERRLVGGVLKPARTHGETDRHTETRRDRRQTQKTDRQTDRQTDRYTETRRDRRQTQETDTEQTDRQTDTEHTDTRRQREGGGEEGGLAAVTMSRRSLEARSPGLASWSVLERTKSAAPNPPERSCRRSSPLRRSPRLKSSAPACTVLTRRARDALGTATQCTRRNDSRVEARGARTAEHASEGRGRGRGQGRQARRHAGRQLRRGEAERVTAILPVERAAARLHRHR